MLRLLCFWILLAAIAAQTFQQAVTLLGYNFYPAPYAKNCENKASPQLKCAGKCQLMKKLQEEENQNQQPNHKLENRQEVLFATHPIAPDPHHLQKGVITSYPQLVPALPIDRSFPFFHPPSSV